MLSHVLSVKAFFGSGVSSHARQLDGSWQRSVYCDGSHSCVEVQFGVGQVFVRDSKHPFTAPHSVIAVEAENWITFITAIKNNQSPQQGPLRLTAAPFGVVLSDSEVFTSLHFTPAEWSAFVAGVQAGQFDPPAAGRLPGCGWPSIDRTSSLVTIGTGVGSIIAQAMGLTGPAAALASAALIFVAYRWNRRHRSR